MNAPTSYARLKLHFDRLILGKYRTNGLEEIRLTYQNLYGFSLGGLDICSDSLQIPTNPIRSIITLVGDLEPDDKPIRQGIIGSNENRVVYLNHFGSQVTLPTWTRSKVDAYIESVFKIMNDIVSCDIFFKPKFYTENQYIELLAIYPLWFTFHHIKNVMPGGINSNIFAKIIKDNYLVDDEEEITHAVEILKKSQYTDDGEVIYSTMTDNGKLMLY